MYRRKWVYAFKEIPHISIFSLRIQYSTRVEVEKMGNGLTKGFTEIVNCKKYDPSYTLKYIKLKIVIPHTVRNRQSKFSFYVFIFRLNVSSVFLNSLLISWSQNKKFPIPSIFVLSPDFYGSITNTILIPIPGECKNSGSDF